MDIIGGLKQMFSDPSIPVSGKIWKLNTQEFNQPLKYDYATIEKLLEDERVSAITVLMASLVQDAYVGPDIHPQDRFEDSVIDTKESKAINEAIKIARRLNFRQLCFDYAWDLITHGDLFEKIIKDSKGVNKLISQPLNSTRVLANKSQSRSRGQGAQILEENFISVKRHENDTDPPILELKKKEYFHLSFKNHAVWKQDIEGSDTYGIYSKAPIAPLQRLVDWKKKTIENDSIWKNKLMPRILHKLKMPSIVPSKYTGTQSEKVAAAKKDADLLTDSFINITKTLRPDDDLVVSDAVDSKILEASSTNYHQPNDTIAQINSLLNTPYGVPNGLLGGDLGASMAIELASVLVAIRSGYIINKIADALADIMKTHVSLAAPSATEEVIDRLYIFTDPSLTIEKFTKVKTALSMAATGQFIRAEIREAAGYPRLPQLPDDMFVKLKIGDLNKSIEDQVGDIKKEGSESNKNNTSPEARRNSTEEQK